MSGTPKQNDCSRCFELKWFVFLIQALYSTFRTEPSRALSRYQQAQRYERTTRGGISFISSSVFSALRTTDANPRSKMHISDERLGDHLEADGGPDAMQNADEKDPTFRPGMPLHPRSSSLHGYSRQEGAVPDDEELVYESSEEVKADPLPSREEQTITELRQQLAEARAQLTSARQQIADLEQENARIRLEQKKTKFVKSVLK